MHPSIHLTRACLTVRDLTITSNKAFHSEQGYSTEGTIVGYPHSGSLYLPKVGIVTAFVLCGIV